jgi:A/G-specific adenine glycosylase
LNQKSGLYKRVKANIIKWFEEYGRDFPWRHDDDPFHVLLAEMLLRRTTAVAVMRVYPSLVKIGGTPEALMNLNRREVESLITPLGLQSVRAKHLQRTATLLVEDHDGSVKAASNNLEDFPGVGRYTACAVRNFAFSIPEPLVDGNIILFLNRVFGTNFKGPEDDATWHFVDNMAGPDHDSRFYWGVIDFVSAICLHQQPRCKQCLLQDDCSFFSERGIK